jgi:hypothetical protein
MKSHEGLPRLRAGASHRGRPVLACALATLVFSPALVDAKDAVRNLGGGLSQLAVQPNAAQATRSAQRSTQGLAAATEAEPEVSVISPVQFDSAGRALVRISLDGKVPTAAVLQTLGGMAGVQVSASDAKYRAGVIEAYVPASSLVSIARSKGVLAVVPTSPMVTNIGNTTSQGVVQHRVDQLPEGVDGSGITVGVMS